MWLFYVRVNLVLFVVYLNIDGYFVIRLNGELDLKDVLIILSVVMVGIVLNLLVLLVFEFGVDMVFLFIILLRLVFW